MKVDQEAICTALKQYQYKNRLTNKELLSEMKFQGFSFSSSALHRMYHSIGGLRPGTLMIVQAFIDRMGIPTPETPLVKPPEPINAFGECDSLFMATLESIDGLTYSTSTCKFFSDLADTILIATRLREGGNIPNKIKMPIGATGTSRVYNFSEAYINEAKVFVFKYVEGGME